MYGAGYRIQIEGIYEGHIIYNTIISSRTGNSSEALSLIPISSLPYLVTFY